MARSGQRERNARRGRGSSGRLGSQELLVYVATGATLVLAAAVIVAGLYLTRYRPPREHVLTVQGERFNAAAVVARGAFLITYQGQASGVDRFAEDAVTVLLNEALLRLGGPALVGEVSAQQVEDRIRIQLGFPPLEPPAEATPADATTDATPEVSATPDAVVAATETATATPDASATATGTPTPSDRAEFAKAYQRYLQLIRLSRSEFERIMRAEIIEQRLRDQFGEAVGASGPQLRLSRIRLSDPALADSIHQQLVDGADFVALHAEHSAGEDEGEGGDLGWAALAALPDATADAVRGLAVGGFSAVVASGLSYDIFLVAEHSTDEPYDADTKEALIDDQIEQWLAVEEARLTVRRELSAGEERWINEHMLERARAIVAAASA